MDDTQIVRLHAVVLGRVQGVGFRAYVLNRAEALGLTGWVRNTSGGTVEVTAEGERQSLDALIYDMTRGPRAASVIFVDHVWQPATGEFSRFDVIGTF